MSTVTLQKPSTSIHRSSKSLQRSQRKVMESPHSSNYEQWERELLERELELELELEKRECEEKYSSFVKSAWDILEPDNPLIWNWHLDYLCDEVEKQIHRIGNKEPKEYDLVVNVPPRSLKSMIFTRMVAPWAWIYYPWMRFMRGSYAEDLALEHAVESRDIIRSDWYQDNWGHKYHLKSDQDNKSHFRTTLNGACFTTSTTGKATGRGANWVGLDDPLSPIQADSDVEREKALRFYKRTIKSRLNNKKVDMIVVIMQRLHERDLTGYILTHEADKFKHICLPAEDAPWVSPPELRKKYVNGLLFPELFPHDILDPIKTDAYLYASQYMQRPSPEEGGEFKRQYWKFWKPAGLDLPAVNITVGLDVYTCEVVDLPMVMDDSVCSWDCAFKDKKTSDFVAGTVWARNGVRKFLLDRRKGKMSYTKTCENIRELKAVYPRTTAVIVEEKANGSAVVEDIKKDVPGVIPENPTESKYARALPMSKQQKAGNLYLPHPAIAPWVEDFIDEFAGFPNAAHDDQVDSSSQAIKYLDNIHKIFPAYKGVTKKFRIGLENISEKSFIICSLWADKKLQTSVLCALWNAKTGQLSIFGEYVGVNTKPEAVILNIINIIKTASGTTFNKEDLQRINWLGNDLMFGQGGLHNLAGAYLTSLFQISILPNELYDEYGAIQSINSMLAMGKIIPHSRTEETKHQMSNWKIEGKEPEHGYGLCRALCNMVSMLFESGTMSQREYKLREYSRYKTVLYNEMKAAHDTGQIGDFVTGKSRKIQSRYGKGGQYV